MALSCIATAAGLLLVMGWVALVSNIALVVVATVLLLLPLWFLNLQGVVAGCVY
jgi:hypothetical protein